MLELIIQFALTDPLGFLGTIALGIGAVFGLKFAIQVISGAINQSKGRRD